MYNPGKGIYTNFGPETLRQRKDRDVSALVVGKGGAGKTSLVNNICGSNFETGCGPKGITRQFQPKKCEIEQGNLELVDSPPVEEAGPDDYIDYIEGR